MSDLFSLSDRVSTDDTKEPTTNFMLCRDLDFNKMRNVSHIHTYLTTTQTNNIHRKRLSFVCTIALIKNTRYRRRGQN